MLNRLVEWLDRITAARCDVCGRPWVPDGVRIHSGGEVETYCGRHRHGGYARSMEGMG